MINIGNIDIKRTPKNYKLCPKCGIRHMNNEQYEGRNYCSKCISKLLEYRNDTFRNKHDIRRQNYNDLNLFQQSQINRTKEQVDNIIMRLQGIKEEEEIEPEISE